MESTSRDFVVIELGKPRKAGSTVFQQLASESAADGPRLKRFALDTRDEQELIASDRYVAHAPSLPLELIRPVNWKTSADAAPWASATTGTTTWGIEAVRASADGFDGAGVSVAIVDSGIDLDHVAFKGISERITVKDFSGAGAGDATGHGTHCAATLFGQDVDGIRIGVARNVSRAFVARVFDDTGAGTSLALFEAMQSAIMWKAQVISMSLGFDFAGDVERSIASGIPSRAAAARALNDFLANMRVFDTLVKLGRDMVPISGGSMFIAAAGNSSQPSYRVPLVQPANADGVISVGAVERTTAGYRVAKFSNTGPTVCAPGVEVLSASSGAPALSTSDGTSMAAPHVAGVAALWFQALKKRGEIAVSTTVTEAVVSQCLSTGFDPSTAVNDRGRGLVRAP